MSSEPTKSNSDLKDKPESKPTEKSISDAAAEALSGDNKFMAAVLKILLSPMALMVGGALVLYWLNMSKGSKQELEKLQQAHENLQEEYAELRRKYKKLKSSMGIQNPLSGKEKERQLPAQPLSYRTNYLD